MPKPLINAPWILGGDTKEEQEAGLRKLEQLVRSKDAQGFYDKYGRLGYTLNFMDKLYIESTIMMDKARE